MWFFKSKSFQYTERMHKRFWLNWTQIGTNWCYSFGKNVALSEREKPQKWVWKRFIEDANVYKLSHLWASNKRLYNLVVQRARLESPFAEDEEFHAKFSKKKRNFFNLNNKRKWKSSLKAHNDLIYSLVFSSPSFPSREFVRIFRYLIGMWKFPSQG